ncbi:Succinyl-CoA:(R)-benzylsuccinate CoA-transferase subunit BbsF [Enhygromyxa salina]|uniref:Succinyl-CoA:(R)-benzylsuccinate CoA-transferase subunit BbsF n=1 Tax=Enhygromyxa salina TaxID=215803 RepID=A0A2S9XJS4_9BACT|nr:CoA transferase [Enhygromyxa salina]PRP93139.1 Succinyl-CoA:(R)-benzylsuccinate CoA-transferase subunit BbsF [Enhygromyxa salina]
MTSDHALAGLRVLELGQLIAGPFAGAMLAGFGAEVIKVEPPGAGDPLRKWRKLHDGTSLWWRSMARNKKSVAIDLRTEQGRWLIRNMVATGEVDVLIENFRPGRMQEWGLGWDDLRALDRRLIMVSISGYGQTGPRAAQPGFANIAEAVGGLRFLSGEPGRPPVRAGVSLGDTVSGLHAAFGALAAVQARDGGPRRRGTGVGQLVDVALSESVFNMLESLLPEYSLFGHVRQRAGSKLEGIVPTGTYPCSPGPGGEDRWVAIGANSDSMFQRLMRVIGREDLAEDPRLRHNDGRVEHEAMLDELIAGFTAMRSPEQALRELDAAQVAAGPIQSIADIAADPQFLAREMFESVELPDGAKLEIPAIVPKLSHTPGRTRWIGPAIGEHTDAVLRQLLGFAAEDLDELAEAGVIERPALADDEPSEA